MLSFTVYDREWQWSKKWIGKRKGGRWDRNSLKLEGALHNLLHQNLNLIFFYYCNTVSIYKMSPMCFHFSFQQIFWHYDIKEGDRENSTLGWRKDMAQEVAVRFKEGMKGCQMWPGGLQEQKIQAGVKGQMHRSLTFPGWLFPGAGNYGNIQVGTGSSKTLGSLVSGTLLWVLPEEVLHMLMPNTVQHTAETQLEESGSVGEWNRASNPARHVFC